jgi:hypothetical protein
MLRQAHPRRQTTDRPPRSETIEETSRMKPFSLLALLLSLGAGTLALQQSRSGKQEAPPHAAAVAATPAPTQDATPPSLPTLSSPSRPSPPTLSGPDFANAAPAPASIVYPEAYPTTDVYPTTVVVIEPRQEMVSHTLLDEHRGSSPFGRNDRLNRAPGSSNPLEAPATQRPATQRAAGAAVQRPVVHTAPVVRPGPAVRTGAVEG